VQQWTCNGGDNQRWKLRGDPAQGWELVNAGSGRCLDGEGTAPGVLGASLSQRGCSGAPGQRWQAVRSGNTFSLRSAAGLCLEVSGQSRADGAPVALAPCTGAAFQQWEIESLRAGDHERMYQADRDRIAWLSAPDGGHPIPVTVDGMRAVCRAGDLLGVVSGDQCVGRRYGGGTGSERVFARLFQAR
jgi:hypothetical protein